MSQIKNVYVPKIKLEGIKLDKMSDTKSKQNNIESIDLTGNSEEYIPRKLNVEYSNIKKDGYTPQGYTTDNNGNVLVSAYSKKGNSRIYVYDKQSGEYKGKIVLDNSEHAGGLSYDPKNNLLFVTGKNTDTMGGKTDQIYTYDYDELSKLMSKNKSGEFTFDLNKPNYHSARIENNINFSNETYEDMATTYYHDGKLYSATFGKKGKLYETSYHVETDSLGNKRVVQNNLEEVGDLPTAVQGIGFYNEGDKEYIVAASSTGNAKSSLEVLEKTDDGLKSVGKQNINHRGLEGIKIDNNGIISGVFEYDGTNIQNISSVHDVINNIKGGNEALTESGQYVGAAFWQANDTSSNVAKEKKR